MTTRRTFLLASALAGLGLRPATAPRAATPDGPTGAGAAAGPAEPFDFDRLIDRASALAGGEFDARALPLEGDFATLSYDQYRDIRFRRQADPLAGSNAAFGVDLLPPGFLFTNRVNVFLVEDGAARSLPFSLDDLDFGPLAPRPSNPEALGWSGLRVRSPVNRPGTLDEIAVFQGASYVRAVARGQRYGLSARGLAIGTASDAGEEFPEFTDFWVRAPSADDTAVVVFALLDSPSATGAYRFEITPGEETVMQVRSVLFPRVDLDDVGIAPLTSMFLFDPSTPGRFDDFRPAVHDSDALRMIAGDGERILRTLANPERLQVSTFADADPIAFGLVQGHRRFDDYEDDEARYELRPDAWVQPTGKWGAGAVELVEIPTDAEIHDNIVAFWRPRATLRAGERQAFDYRLSWTSSPSDDVPLLRVRDVRSGARPDGAARTFVVDFRVPDGSAADPRAVLASSAGTVSDVTGGRLDANGDYRVSFAFDPGEADLAEFRLQLRTDDGPASETWLYRWTRRG